MQTIREDKVNMPCYAMPYLINNDDSGLTEEDKQLIDTWYNKLQKRADRYNAVIVIGMPADNDNGSFTSSPLFGLPCDCFEITITMLA